MRSAYGLEVDRDNTWRHHAACTPETAEWFWLLGNKLSADNHAALDLCGACPVTAECLAFELTHPSRYTRIAGGVVVSSGGKVREP